MYGYIEIANELQKTAQGEAYYGNALRVAKDIPEITPEERSVLDAFATGKYSFENRMALQDIAIKIRHLTTAST